MLISIPLFDPFSGRTTGVLVGRARLKRLWNLVNELPTHHAGTTTFVTDGSGSVVVHPDPSVVLAGTTFALPPSSPAIAPGLNQSRSALAFERLNFGGQVLHVIAEQPLTQVMSLAQNLVIITLVLAALTLTLAVALSIPVIANITRPLQKLAAAARSIRDGHPLAPLDVRATSEVGELANAFTDMTSRLHESLHDMAREIDERKRSEAALAKSRAILRQILDTLIHSVFWKDTNSVYLGCNRVFARSAGFDDPQQIVGRTDVDLPWPPGEAESCRADDREVIETGHPKRRIVGPRQPPDGRRVWLDSTKVPLLDENGAVQGVLGVYVDITDRKLAEEERRKLETQLVQAQKMEAIGTLAGGIAHDFNNILAAIIGFTELAQLKTPADAPTVSYLDQVLLAGKRAKELVRQILTYSRKGREEMLIIEPQPIIKEGLKLLRASIPASIEIQSEINPQVGPILADPTKIHQVLMNLCTNAYHAMRDRGGTIRVELTPVDLDAAEITSLGLHLQPGPHVRLAVSDTGHGMSPNVLDRIFEPYFTTKRSGEGTGMGLAVVHGIVRSHHGAIHVTSTVNQGTTFTVFLPRLIQPTGEMPSTLGDRGIPGGTERILLVDDEQSVARMASALLDGLGYQTTAITDSSEALRLFAEAPERFDLVLTDMSMPGMTGLDLARELLILRPDLPIVLCTGFNESVDRDAALAQGLREFLQKPTTRRELAEIVRRILDSPPA